MRAKINLLIFSLLFLMNTIAQEKKTFATIQEVFEYTKSNNITFQNAALQIELAKLTKKSSVLNAINPKIPSSYQAINNQNQQVSFLPGQAFGLPAGTFKEVTIGQQYVSTFSIQPQFDILNLATITQIKSAKLNEQLIENQNKINQQNLFEKINSVYFNILALNAQKEIVASNIEIATKIVTITTNKFNEGLARKQEVNEAEVNLINLKDKMQQIEYTLQIQQQTLGLFFENKILPSLSQSITDFEKSTKNSTIKNELLVENSSILYQIAKQDLKSIRLQQLPVVSFISSYNWQNLSNDNFYATNSNRVNFNYVGLKVNYDLPTNVQKHTAVHSKSIQLKMAEFNAEHSKKENENRNNQLLLETEKAIAQLENLKKIVALKEDSYQKNNNQYIENILPLDKLLISQNDLIMSQLNVISALATIGYNKTKIEIYNGN
jgi:outer membrane protein TolC